MEDERTSSFAPHAHGAAVSRRARHRDSTLRCARALLIGLSAHRPLLVVGALVQALVQSSRSATSTRRSTAGSCQSGLLFPCICFRHEWTTGAGRWGSPLAIARDDDRTTCARVWPRSPPGWPRVPERTRTFCCLSRTIRDRRGAVTRDEPAGTFGSGFPSEERSDTTHARAGPGNRPRDVRS